MPKICFLKEINSSSFIVDGRPVPFEALPQNQGVIALEPGKDDRLIGALTKAADAHVGGVVRITEEELASKKVQAASMPLTPPRKKEMLRQMPRGPLQKQPAADSGRAAVPGVNPAAPRPETLPITKSALRDAAATEGRAPKIHEPVPPFMVAPPPAAPTAPAPVQSAPPADAPVVEGFRPATRRIRRKESLAAAAA